MVLSRVHPHVLWALGLLDVDLALLNILIILMIAARPV